MSHGNPGDIVMVLSSIPRKVSSDAVPSTMSTTSGTPSSWQVACVVYNATAHSFEFGWLSRRKSLRW